MIWQLQFEGVASAWLRDRISAEVRTASQALSSALQPDVAVPPVTVVVACNPAFIIPDLGLGGSSLRPGLISIYLDSANPNFEASLAGGQFTRTLTHEFHHCLRHAGAGYGMTLAGAIVSEGLADHFDREINGGDGQPWDHALHAEQWPSLLARVELELNASPYDHARWFFGVAGQQEEWPRWAGYSVGYALIGCYLRRHPQARPSRMGATPAQDIINAAWKPLVETMAAQSGSIA
jgi:uncharacterized protein YjaZ